MSTTKKKPENERKKFLEGTRKEVVIGVAGGLGVGLLLMTPIIVGYFVWASQN